MKLKDRIREIVDQAIASQDLNFNDSITRKEIHTMVMEALKDIKARKGVQDYEVICDETNNPPEVIDQSTIRVRVNYKVLGRLDYVARQAVPRKLSIGADFGDLLECLSKIMMEDYE